MPDEETITVTDEATSAEEHPAQVPWDEYVKLRHENEEYRKTWQPFEKTFGEYDPETRDAWLEFAQGAGRNPEAAVSSLAEQLGYRLTPAEQAEMAQALEGFDPQEEVITKAEMEQRLAEIEDERQADMIEDHLRRLGVDPGTPAAETLLVRAAREGGDLDKTYQSVLQELADYEQQVREKYLEERRQDANQSVSPPAPAAGVPASGEQVPHDFATAKAAMLERIRHARASGDI